jgi:hypothetical protein
VTTFWLTFSTDPVIHISLFFRGVAIFDLDESDGELPNDEIIRHADEKGFCPEGRVYVCVQDVTKDNIPAQYKNKLITDHETLVAVGAEMAPAGNGTAPEASDEWDAYGDRLRG